MPELPDITVYLEALQARILNAHLESIRLNSPFLVRTVAPPIEIVRGREVVEMRRIGKRIAIGLSGGVWAVLHLMIAGRLHWKKGGAALASRIHLAAFDFTTGTLTLTEAGKERRASLHLIDGEDGLLGFNAGGIEPLESSVGQFTAAVQRENHTLKRALTDPHIFSGIGNAYSDEILHAARLSPMTLTSRLKTDEIARLHAAVRSTLEMWTARLREEAAGGFPEKVTAFREGMAVHGRFGQPCPVCETKVQRIRYASNETNYCPRCQTGGKLLADRSLSRLLREDWPKSIDDLP